MNELEKTLQGIFEVLTNTEYSVQIFFSIIIIAAGAIVPKLIGSKKMKNSNDVKILGRHYTRNDKDITAQFLLTALPTIGIFSLLLILIDQILNK